MTRDRIVYDAGNKQSGRQNYKRRFFGAAMLLILAAVIYGAVYAIRYPRWQISRIEIAGTETLDKDALADFLKDKIGGNRVFFAPKSSFFLIRTENLSQVIASQFLKIDSIEIRKKFPDTISISLRERKLWGIYCNNLSPNEDSEERGDAACAYIDTRGFAYGTAPDSRGSLIVKIKSDGTPPGIGSQIISEDAAEKMRHFSRELKTRLDIETVGFELLAKLPAEFRAVTADGFRIYVNRDDDFENSFRVLSALFQGELKNKKENLAYIDARFGNKVFYKLK